VSKITLALSLLFSLITVQGLPQAWSPPVRVSPEGQLAYYAVMTADHSGEIWCSWIHYAISPLCVSYYDGNVWSDPDTLYPGHSFSRDMVTDRGGNVWVIWDDELWTGFFGRYYDGIRWSDLMTVYEPAFFTKATVDSAGHIWVSWSTDLYGYFRVCSNFYDGSNWSSRIQVSGDMEGDCANSGLATDKYGTIWSAWDLHQVDSNSVSINSICTSTNDGSGWSEPSRVLTIYQRGLLCGDLAVTRDGTLWCSYGSVHRDTTWIYAIKHDSLGWSTPMLVHLQLENPEASCGRIVTDSEDRVWMVWGMTVGGESLIHYSLWNGSQWSTPALIDTCEGFGAGITYDPISDRIWVAWTSLRDGYWAVYASYTQAVGVEERSPNPRSPSFPRLFQNYPNPAQGRATINYQLPQDMHVALEIYSLAGQHVRTLVNESLRAGYYTAVWDGRDSCGQQVASGVYFYRLSATSQGGSASGGRAGDLTLTKQLVVLR